MGPDFFAYLLLHMINGDDWHPEYAESNNYKNWIAVLDLRTCFECRNRHGMIWLITDTPEKEPPLHTNCRCDIITMKSIRAGTATISGKNGADWLLKYDSKLPEYYITKEDAIKKGYHPILGNLSRIAPGKSITNGEYYNRNGHLPKADGRIWYEADINYKYGYRNSQRIIWSNDGLIFVTFDHYKTFFEII